jgi:hypothetical protein
VGRTELWMAVKATSALLGRPKYPGLIGDGLVEAVEPPSDALPGAGRLFVAITPAGRRALGE